MRRAFAVTNCFIAAATDEPESGAITANVLHCDHELLMSRMNRTEPRSILKRKRRLVKAALG